MDFNTHGFVFYLLCLVYFLKISKEKISKKIFKQIANQIKQGTDTRLLKCLEKVDILIFPCLNPDGYEFTRSDPRNPAVSFIE